MDTPQIHINELKSIYSTRSLLQMTKLSASGTALPVNASPYSQGIRTTSCPPNFTPKRTSSSPPRWTKPSGSGTSLVCAKVLLTPAAAQVQVHHPRRVDRVALKHSTTFLQSNTSWKDTTEESTMPNSTPRCPSSYLLPTIAQSRYGV